ncbi:hypothetical protein FVB9532_02228 [Mesonia oceanica]|uniref:Uncharacterized protein n=1 Tax=Mesonia oceanica TaxID=2687242 RepID=A0AC61Y8Y5_9FLAO|nr:hypothetical protein FVB9532_02228 [Mesonia oceanica]
MEQESCHFKNRANCTIAIIPKRINILTVFDYLEEPKEAYKSNLKKD